MGWLGDDPRVRPDRLGFLLTFGEDRGKLWLDSYELALHETDADLAELNALLARVCPELPDAVAGLRCFRLGSKIGVEYPLRPPYPPGTYRIGNAYLEDPDTPGVLQHLDPDEMAFAVKKGSTCRSM